MSNNLQCVGIASYATAHSAITAMCLSITRWYCVKMTQRRIMNLHWWIAPRLWFLQEFIKNLKYLTQARMLNKRGDNLAFKCEKWCKMGPRLLLITNSSCTCAFDWYLG